MPEYQTFSFTEIASNFIAIQSIGKRLDSFFIDAGVSNVQRCQTLRIKRISRVRRVILLVDFFSMSRQDIWSLLDSFCFSSYSVFQETEEHWEREWESQWKQIVLLLDWSSASQLIVSPSIHLFLCAWDPTWWLSRKERNCLPVISVWMSWEAKIIHYNQVFVKMTLWMFSTDVEWVSSIVFSVFDCEPVPGMHEMSQWFDWAVCTHS
jgi:hypothetical protein